MFGPLFREWLVAGLAFEHSLSATNRRELAGAFRGGVHGNRLRVLNALVNERALTAPNWPTP